MLEILAPAGNAECAKAAIASGANAIYLGLNAFSARQSAENFDEAAFRAIVNEAHLCGVKVYVAMNTAVKNSELDEFFDSLTFAWRAGADAIILQDALLGKAIHEKYPEIVLHLSTQAGVCNLEGAKFAKECGFSRVILARETETEDIRKIADFIETEVFVQGALCTCFSGQCYLSSFAGGNSGNRGRCKQPCRKTYRINRSGYEEKAYALSLSDLSVGEDIRKLAEAGVVSFKIEGRMRRAEYVAASVGYYRSVLDGKSEKEKTTRLSDLKRTYNRGNYTKGLAFGQDKRFLSRAVQGHIGEKVGVVKVASGSYFVESAFKAQKGDAFKILRSGKEVGGAIYLKTDKRGFLLSSKVRLLNGDGVFVTTDTALNERLLAKERKMRLSLTLSFEVGKKALAVGGGVTVYSEEILSPAESRPLSVEEIKNCFEKTDGLPVEVEFEKIVLNGDVFFAKSRLNAFRRAFYAEFLKSHTGERESEEIRICVENIVTEKNKKIAVIARDFSSVSGVDIAIFKPDDYGVELPASFVSGSFEKYLYYPAYLTGKDIDRLSELCASGIDGVYAENYGGLIFAKERGLKVFAGTGFNLFNSVAIAELLKEETLAYFALSKELEREELAAFASEKAFSLSSGNLKVMELCYCPFEKTCVGCDKKSRYDLTDENGREFPLRRYRVGGACRFEVYNCADLVGESGNLGQLLDLTLLQEPKEGVEVADDIIKQKKFYQKYTFGHTKANGLL